MIEQCGITRRKSRQLWTLSKGDRQRVGLVQALIDNSQVLILSASVAGLDLSQLRGVRVLIIRSKSRQGCPPLHAHHASSGEAVWLGYDYRVKENDDVRYAGAASC